jgi:hypothetical protein
MLTGEDMKEPSKMLGISKVLVLRVFVYIKLQSAVCGYI